VGLRLAALASAALAFAAAGCASSHAKPAGIASDWPPVGRACLNGAGDCVALVARAMTRRYDPLAAACDHDAPFALMYLRVTQRVDREERSFAARRYLAELDAVFARLYFVAYDAWRSDRRGAVPAAWRIAFEAADRRRVSGIGDLLLGMNAHISRDLPFAVAALGLPPAELATRRRAFERVNAVLERAATPIVREASRRFDPTISSFSLPVLSATPQTFGAVLAGWRDAALQDAERLLHAGSRAQRAAVAQRIDQTAAARAALIAAATSRVPYSRAGKARDAYCRSR